MESGAIIGLDGEVLHWHAPQGRTVASLPDSRSLWEEIWDRRETVKGVAHSHPGGGVPGPSWTDVTTFSAIELGLGKRLSWWITSSSACIVVKWVGPEKYQYEAYVLHSDPKWADDLRKLGEPSEKILNKEGT